MLGWFFVLHQMDFYPFDVKHVIPTEFTQSKSTNLSC